MKITHLKLRHLVLKTPYTNSALITSFKYVDMELCLSFLVLFILFFLHSTPIAVAQNIYGQII
jgi:hypothetical protein